eukprot:TRINITY_DN1714_c0_g1_i1.p1 TRINITY_DN1714_c0_g1~~TRINITY_DN1714_c0_g1_i1.p1  ORF type:complete len:297 (+),score=49.84 TRINITY_DN1714_c0_g1_i1:59-892(+)
MAVMSDGNCGSACSLVSTILQFSGRVAVYTWGGWQDEILDATSFTGGNVEEWNDFWPQANEMVVIANFVSRLQGQGVKYNLDHLSFRMPTGAAARFNFHQMYHRALGKMALPREWYRIPPHDRISLWPRPSVRTQNGRLAVYQTIMNKNWTSIRNSPKYNAATCTKPPADGYERWDFDALKSTTIQKAAMTMTDAVIPRVEGKTTVKPNVAPAENSHDGSSRGSGKVAMAIVLTFVLTLAAVGAVYLTRIKMRDVNLVENSSDYITYVPVEQAEADV